MNPTVFTVLLLGAAAAGVLTLTMGASAETTGASSAAFESKVRQFAEAIGYAEGFWNRNRVVNLSARPGRNNNPGDIEGTGDAGSDGVYAVFSTQASGWARLYAQVRLDFSGGSKIYSPQMTISDYAWTYTGTQPDAWSDNVASWLGVSRDMKISDWLAS